MECARTITNTTQTHLYLYKSWNSVHWPLQLSTWFENAKEFTINQTGKSNVGLYLYVYSKALCYQCSHTVCRGAKINGLSLLTMHHEWNWHAIVQSSPTYVHTHDDVIKWKHFPRNWPFVRGIHRPMTRSFDVFFDLRLNKRLSKRSWSWLFQTQSPPWWR